MAQIQYDTGHLDRAEQGSWLALERDTSKIPDVHLLLVNVYRWRGPARVSQTPGCSFSILVISCPSISRRFSATTWRVSSSRGLVPWWPEETRLPAGCDQVRGLYLRAGSSKLGEQHFSNRQ